MKSASQSAIKKSVPAALLKWPGGKRLLLPHLIPFFGEIEGRYYEPFIGGGAVFAGIGPSNATIADANPELTNCYEQIKENVHAVAKALATWPNTEVMYYKIRSICSDDPTIRAARLIYLTTLSFNGIYRQNLAGMFNVPYGHKTHIELPKLEYLTKVSLLLKETQIRTGDFEETVADAGWGDCVYFDPPYTVAHKNNGFVKYNAKIFSWSDQRRLASFAERLSSRGCVVVISNADHPSIIELYKSFRMVRVQRYSIIAASSSKRRQISECIFTNNRSALLDGASLQ